MENISANDKNWKSMIKPTKLDIQLSKDKTKAKIIAEPLEKGYGLTLGNKNKVNTYANSHFEAAKILKTKPCLEHLIKDNNVKKKYIKSKLEIFSKILIIPSIIKFFISKRFKN